MSSVITDTQIPKKLSPNMVSLLSQGKPSMRTVYTTNVEIFMVFIAHVYP